MGCDYFCSTCRLMFTIGWDHYHSFDRGYGAMTQLVCRRCGNQHYVEHAIDPTKPDRLLGTRQPQRWPAERSDKPTSWQLPQADWVEPMTDFELRPNRVSASSPRLAGIDDTLELSRRRACSARPSTPSAARGQTVIAVQVAASRRSSAS